jgi:hypothetical protein
VSANPVSRFGESHRDLALDLVPVILVVPHELDEGFEVSFEVGAIVFDEDRSSRDGDPNGRRVSEKIGVRNERRRAALRLSAIRSSPGAISPDHEAPGSTGWSRKPSVHENEHSLQGHDGAALAATRTGRASSSALLSIPRPSTSAPVETVRRERAPGSQSASQLSSVSSFDTDVGATGSEEDRGKIRNVSLPPWRQAKAGVQDLGRSGGACSSLRCS